MQLCDSDLKAANAADDPDRVKPIEVDVASANIVSSISGASKPLTLELQPASWNMIRLHVNVDSQLAKTLGKDSSIGA
ncbi:hypothetical protein [Poriferisphaera sp. WC338]|uniref:hypothetical protein n=1 Tax=Poriferisphaera sp. WC338 TaxID=3425129 RepID=UPI003D8195E6